MSVSGKSVLITFGILLVSCGNSATIVPSPFAEKPCESYSGYTDESGQPAVLLWGKAPLEDFGSRPVTFDQTGVRLLRQAPPAGVHPRIFFGPADLPDVRKRIRETRCGQEAMKNILCWTEMMKGRYDDKATYAQPDRWNGSFGKLHGRVPLFRLGMKGGYNQNPGGYYQKLMAGDASDTPAFFWNVLALEAFRCLIEADEASAKDLARATVALMKADQTKRATDPKALGKVPAQPVGAFQLAFVYDFIFNWLTPEQKMAMHDELALGTWSHDNYGTFNTAENSRSNWATFSYWLYAVLAIEGEPGYNDLKVRGMYRGWRNLLTYGWFQSGATFEGEAKNQLGMDGILLFATRTQQYGLENLCGHPYLRAYATRFLPHSVNPMQTGFHKYDLLGGSHARPMAADALGLKFMFPNDRIIDWVYRKAVGENYEDIPDRPDGYFNGLLFFAVYASDFDIKREEPDTFGLGNTFFCGERALLMTRSGWEKDAVMLNLHTRAANGGHAFSDRNAIMVAGAGRVWSPNGYASFNTAENSVVCIDGKNQTLTTPGRMVDFQDAQDATFAVGDAKYCWDWSWKSMNKRQGYYTVADVRAGKVEIPTRAEIESHTVNDFAYTKLPFTYLNVPLFEAGHWILPKGALSPTVREPNYPVRKAFRTAGLVRGEHPYILILDDIQKDDKVHRYDWTLTLEKDIQIVSAKRTGSREMDVLLTGSGEKKTTTNRKEVLPSCMTHGIAIPTGQPMLLVRVLNVDAATMQSDVVPEIVELPNVANPAKYGTIRRLRISVDAVSPAFKVLLYPHRNGAPLPITEWNGSRTMVSLGMGALCDSIRFSDGISGKTDVAIMRGSFLRKKTLIRVDRPILPLKDPIQEARSQAEAALAEKGRRELK